MGIWISSLTILWPLSVHYLFILWPFSDHSLTSHYLSSLQLWFCDQIWISRCNNNQWPFLTVETFHQWWITALPLMTGIRCFSSFYRWKIKLLYLFLDLLIQIWSQNHKCNTLNVFLPFLPIIMRGQRMDRERSNILWPSSQPVSPG